ncbi:MAG: hypothetical protein ABIJ27_02820 [Candidatus Omnitrophota bacterium]
MFVDKFRIVGAAVLCGAAMMCGCSERTSAQYADDLGLTDRAGSMIPAGKRDLYNKAKTKLYDASPEDRQRYKRKAEKKVDKKLGEAGLSKYMTGTGNLGMYDKARQILQGVDQSMADRYFGETGVDVPKKEYKWED